MPASSPELGTDTTLWVRGNYGLECDARNGDGWYCERRTGHPMPHAAFLTSGGEAVLWSSLPVRRSSPTQESSMPLTDSNGDESNDIVEPVKASCNCESCKFKRFEGSKLRSAVVQSYSYRPRGGWKDRSVKDDPFNYGIGIELETDNYFRTGGAYGGRTTSTVSNGMAVSMKRPAALWIAKHDGSISGPEFVSHPATLTYWRKHKAALAEMFKMLVHAGYRSHDNDSCGMHINIGKNAFATPAHLFRFLSLVHHTPAWSLKMSQRTASSASQWASLDYLSDEVRREGEANNQFSTSYRGGQSSQKYQAVNCMRVQNRFEFRLPRGTLRLDRFMKNLEWTVAMVEYTRTGLVANANPTEFMAWVKLNKADYPYLFKFFIEKGMIAGRVTAKAKAKTAITGKRAYNRRPGSNPPGRPVGYSPRTGYSTPLEMEAAALAAGETTTDEDRADYARYAELVSALSSTVS